jgi:hypothetical protein
MKNKRIFFACLLIGGCMLLSPPSSQGDDGAFDKYGGWTGLKGTKTGVFHVEAIHDRWWLVTPAGNVFWSTGMYSVRMGGIPETGTGRRPYQEAAIKRHGSEREWARVTLLRLKDWGFNTIGDWSSESVFSQGGFVYVFGINLPHVAPNVIAKGAYGYFPDVFDPSFQQSVYASMEKRFKSQPYLIDDPWLLGYFLADEPSWYGSKQRHGALTDDFIALSADRSGKQSWVQFLKTKYGEIGKLNEAWGTQYTDFRLLLDIVTLEDNEYTIKDKKAFLKAVALRFSQVLFTTLRHFDPHHMVLGTRPTRTYPEVLEAIGEYTDVFGVSHYQLNTGYKIALDFERQISDLYSYGKKPILLGVLISGQDTGLPYGLVKTQQDRGISYWRYLAKVASDPRIVGMHWFQYFDPPRKCYDKMAANWGLVNDQDEPYKDAVDLVRQANQMVYAYALGVSHFAPDFDNLLGLQGGQASEEIPGGSFTTIKIPIVNGDFEARNRGWKMQSWKGGSKAAIDGTQKHGGQYALKISGGQEPGWDSVGVAVQYSPNFILKPGLEYKLSAWIKTKDVESFAQVRIKTASPSGTVAHYKAGGQYGTQDWTKYEAVFTPLEDSKADYLVVQLVGKGTAWFDDLALEVSSLEGSDYRDFLRQQEETKTNVPDIRMLRTRPLPVSNSGFEQGDKDWGLQPWKGKPRVGVAWLKGHNSTRALEIKGAADGWDSVGAGVQALGAIMFDPDKEYLLKGWIKTANVSDAAFLRVKVKYDNGQEEYFETGPVSATSDWTQAQKVFRLKGKGTADYLACQLVGSGTAWFDDVSLEEIIPR